jgi:hypothetical protein
VGALPWAEEKRMAVGTWVTCGDATSPMAKYKIPKTKEAFL